MASGAGKVYLVGAGPGAVDLLTLRGARVLARAEVLVYDSLVNPELLKLAPPTAEQLFAGKRGGSDTSLPQAQITQILIDRARAGLRVVRLKGGDPFLFGRGGEEAEALAHAGIPFEIVPGVSSALAVPAAAGIPLTHRDYGSFVTIVTGHQVDANEPEREIRWDELARTIQHRGTLVILMGVAQIRSIVAGLLAGGLSPATPAAAIQWGATAAQRTVTAKLHALADAIDQAALGAPAVIVIGDCARLRDQLQWLERLPLFGRRIVVTRAAEDNSDFAAKLRDRGAEVIEFPTIAIAPPSNFAAIDNALSRAHSFDWIIFTSARGVDKLLERLRDTDRDIRQLGAASLAAIGPATAARLRHYGLCARAVPAEYRAEAIVEAIGIDQIAGRRFLIPRAEVAREILPETLEQLGAREVVVAPVYRTLAPPSPDSARLRELAMSGMLDCVCFTSSSTVINFCSLLSLNGAGLKAAVIGPITEATARANGFEILAAAQQYTTDGLIAALVRALGRTPPSEVDNHGLSN